MSSVHAAIESAKTYLAEVYQDKGIEDLLLEEVEVDDAVAGCERWRVTISFRLTDAQSSGAKETPQPLGLSSDFLTILNPAKPGRHYKVLEVDFKTHAVLAMRIRNFAAA